jgi:inner membrane protein
MEPVTHMLTGAVLARTGLNRKAAYMTAAMVIAAEFPDVDTVWGVLGPVASLEHHRGITHTFVALPAEAAVITLGFWAWHRWRGKATKAPVSWGWLYGGVLFALLSHLLLDWTNNYGLRPFFPFNPRWYAGSFVFIFEPVLFLMLVAALVGPALFGLINAEIGARRTLFRGRPSAIVALIGVALLYAVRYAEHARAVETFSHDVPDQFRSAFASPYPVDPFRWRVVTDEGDRYQLNTVNTRTGLVDQTMPADTIYKPATTLALLAAKRSYLGTIYLDWSSYPVLTEAPDNSDPNHPLTAVTFSDARFFYNVSFFRGRPENGSAPPLSGTVLLDMNAAEGQRVIETRMGSRVQK